MVHRLDAKKEQTMCRSDGIGKHEDICLVGAAAAVSSIHYTACESSHWRDFAALETSSGLLSAMHGLFLSSHLDDCSGPGLQEVFRREAVEQLGILSAWP
ncbi:hypothetical protein CSPX01_02274 [Colletotrichum filicis]|nr:hypothetical protein CSPX01_02274 [Colletotrichum filicis]